MASDGRRRGRRSRSKRVYRCLAAGALVLLAVLYYQPVRSYLETRDALDRRAAEVRALEAEHRSLERRLARASIGASVLRQARRLGYVRPGERLFIVKGIDAWRRQGERAGTITADGRPSGR